jgi:hypothetical protein
MIECMDNGDDMFKQVTFNLQHPINFNDISRYAILDMLE